LSDPALEGFQVDRFTHEAWSFPVYRAGRGPVVIVMHEIPGLHPAVLRFARDLVASGLSVWLPSLLGAPGAPVTVGALARSLARACVAREFTVWATGQNSEITRALRALAAQAHAETSRPVGAVGMCLTGGFALAMMVDPFLAAPVLSQPSLPFGARAAQRRDLGVDAPTLEAVKARCQAGAQVLGLRFSGDPLSPAARFTRLREELGEAFLAVEVDSSWGNPAGVVPWAHSVLATHRTPVPGHPTEVAFERVVRFLHERLGVTDPAPP
jgi:dienelactone hydrolase